MIGAATEKARLQRFSFVLGIESCCEVDLILALKVILLDRLQGIICSVIQEPYLLGVML